jgi:hypothetical protein
MKAIYFKTILSVSLVLISLVSVEGTEVRKVSIVMNIVVHTDHV